MKGSKQQLQQAFQRKCPNCGAPLKFDPKSGQLACSHCKSTVEFVKRREVREREFWEMQDFTPWDEGQLAHYRCNNCGATSVLARTTLATKCPFCDSPVVVDEYATGLVRPDSLIPFELTHEQAAHQLAAWRRRKVFAPRKFRRNTRADSLKGVYVPAWTFDATTVSHYRGKLGKHKTRTVHRDGKSYTETYTEWFYVEGDIARNYDDIFIRGSNSLEQTYFDQLQTGDKSKYVLYDDKYLAGYIADNYTVQPMDAYQLARRRIDSDIRRCIISRYGADEEGYLNVNTDVTSRSFKYMMLPIYVAATKYGGRVYNQYVSGYFSDTGRTKAQVCGKFPKSGWKIFFTVLAVVAFVIGVIAMMLFIPGGEWSIDWGDPWYW